MKYIPDRLAAVHAHRWWAAFLCVGLTSCSVLDGLKNDGGQAPGHVDISEDASTPDVASPDVHQPDVRTPDTATPDAHHPDTTPGTVDDVGEPPGETLHPMPACPSNDLTCAQAYDFSANHEHICIITPDRAAVACLGKNDQGQLGSSAPATGATAFVEVPFGELAGNPGALEFDHIAAGGDHSCTTLTISQSHTQRVYCWGNSDHSRFESAASTPAGTPAGTPAWVPEIGGYTSLRIAAIHAGARHTCVSTSATTLCWGDNSDSQTGNGSGSTSPVLPVNAGTIQNLEDIRQFSTQWNHGCAIAKHAGPGDISAWCWGRNQHAELGQGKSDSSSSLPKKLPTYSTSAPDFPQAYRAIVAGYDHTCAIADVEPDNSLERDLVYCWGNRQNSAKLGNLSPIVNQPDTQSGVKMRDGQPLHASMLALGEDFSCALTRDDSRVVCWGGSDINPDNARARPVAGLNFADTDVIKLDTMGDKICALLESRTSRARQLRCIALDLGHD